jgi:hypothetical protein
MPTWPSPASRQPAISGRNKHVPKFVIDFPLFSLARYYGVINVRWTISFPPHSTS